MKHTSTTATFLALASAASLCGFAIVLRDKHVTEHPTQTTHFARLIADSPHLENIISGFRHSIIGDVPEYILPDVVSGASGSGSTSSSSSAPSGGSSPQGGGGDDKCNDELTKQCDEENTKSRDMTCAPGDESCVQSFNKYTNPASKIPYEGNDAKGKDSGKGSKGQKKCIAAKESGNCAQKCGRGGYSETPDTSGTGLNKSFTQCKDGGDSNSDICRQSSKCPKEGGGGGSMPCIPMPSEEQAPPKKPAEDPCKSPLASKIAMCNPDMVKEPPSCLQFVVEPTKIYRGESVDFKWVAQSKGTLTMRIRYMTVNERGRTKVGTIAVNSETDVITEFPEYSTTYSLILKNEAGSRSCPPVKVKVYPSDTSKAFTAAEDEEVDEEASEDEASADVDEEIVDE